MCRVGFLQLVLPAKPLSSPRGLAATLGIFIFEVDLFNDFQARKVLLVSFPINILVLFR